MCQENPWASLMPYHDALTMTQVIMITKNKSSYPPLSLCDRLRSSTSRIKPFIEGSRNAKHWTMTWFKYYKSFKPMAQAKGNGNSNLTGAFRMD